MPRIRPRAATALLLSLALSTTTTAARGRTDDATKPIPADRLFARENLVAWCIVPFDSKHRGPEDRAAMLERLGFRHFVYDWRAEHVPTFDAEMDALARHKIALDGFWLAPGELNDDARRVLEVLKRHGIKTRLWVLLDLGQDQVTGAEQKRRVEVAAAKLKPLAEEAAKVGCTLALYNHGGWFGEPENQLAIVEELNKQGVKDVGIVYNLHHGHEHLDRLAEVLHELKPHLVAVNLNGSDRGGDKVGRKILPLGQGEMDLEVLRTIRDSGYRGPIGILGHTDDDAEARLKDNLDGLDWLVPQLDGKDAGPRPTPRTPVPPQPQQAAATPEFDPALVAALVRQARAEGDARHGAEVFATARSACLSCHKVGNDGGTVGPDLSAVGTCLKPEEVVEAVLWPRRKVKDEYRAVTVATADGRVRQGYRKGDTDAEIVLRDPASGETFRVAKSDVEEIKDSGTLMPEGLTAPLTATERRDLIRFLLDLGHPGAEGVHHPHAPATFAFDRAPLHPDRWPSWQHHVNRQRLYDFYAKEAEYFLTRPEARLLPQFPGLDGGVRGHWGNQDEQTWADDRWNRTDLGSLLSGVFRGAGLTVPKAVCVRLGDRGELSACFDPETLTYPAVWAGGFVNFAPKRHGFLDGILMDGATVPRKKSEGQADRPKGPAVYRGFYRHGKRVIFAYRVGDVEMLDAPAVEDGRFTRVVAPRGEHPLESLTHGGPAQWPEVIETKGTLGKSGPYAVDTIEPPFKNPWNALMFFGDHDFNADGTAYLCTMQGDVWRVEGLDDNLQHVRWKRFATGLHQALGLVVAEGKVHVLGRDQITRLHDLNGDGEADFYECVSNAYVTSPAGHDFITGLQRDAQGRFYTVSGKQGLIRISADGMSVETIATGFRNADGLGLSRDGVITVPNSEGEWVPASMVCEVRPGGHYGYLGPRDGKAPDLPLVYLPRGLDNSSGGQAFVEGDRFGPLKGQLIHLSFGAGTAYLVLREQVDGQPQGAAVPLTGEFLSGAHRGRFNPKDGQLYVSGMSGWGTYTPLDGCFQRVRYTGTPARLPVAFHAHENGVRVAFSEPLITSEAGRAERQLVQAWNYRYSSGYGSPEFATSHPGLPGHDRLTIASAHVLDDGRSVFLEIPELQPVDQLHLHLRLDGGEPVDLYATVHKLAPPFSGFPGARPTHKTIAAHPIQADMAALAHKPAPNPWHKGIPGARTVTIEAGKNLTYTVRSFKVRAGEPIRLVFHNPDVVPHNWALVRPGTLARVGDLTNKIVAEPDAALRHYIPKTDDVLAYTDIVPPQDQFTINFRAPDRPGRYPYLCTFPGHWMVMNGEMIVE